MNKPRLCAHCKKEIRTTAQDDESKHCYICLRYICNACANQDQRAYHIERRKREGY